MKTTPIATAFALAFSVFCSVAVSSDVAVVKCTIAGKKDPAQAKGYGMHLDTLAKKLQRSGVSFDTVTDEQVIAGKLAAYRLAIFPYNTVSGADEIKEILAFVQGGGKLVWFYAFPKGLGSVLGVEQCSYRGKKYDHEFFTMKFAADRPAGFPAEVRQESPNSRIIEKVTPSSRVIAVWHDKEGKSTDIPAVILSPSSVYVAHVLWSDADADQQTQLLLGAIGHFLPQKWTELVEGALGKAISDAGCQRVDQLVEIAKNHPVALPMAEKAVAQVQEARKDLTAKRFSKALAVANAVRCGAQNVKAATFASRPYELRGAWIHPNDATDWEALMAKLKAANFNAVFPLMAGPASASYPSRFATQTTRRDHMRECLDAARRYGIEVHVWKANWQVLSSSEKAASQKFTDERRFVLSLEQAQGRDEKSSYQWSTRWLDPSDDRNRQLEYDMMAELVEKYHPDGVHFDFMRYPEINYCYCDRCRIQFEKWAVVKVGQWPQDCSGKGPLVEKFRNWWRHLQTSLVKRVAEGVRRIDPYVKVSLAGRSSMTGSYESDAQDWVTWAKQGYLDFLCPMDYTDRVDVLRNKLAPQVAAIEGAVPIYAGLGVSPTRSATPVNLSEQIALARDLGADGFVVFALSPFSEAMLPAIHLGATSTSVTTMPHHAQVVRATFNCPAVAAESPKRTYAISKGSRVAIQLAGTTKDVKEITASVYRLPAAGGNEEPIAEETRGPANGVKLLAPLPEATGIYVIVVRGEATLADGTRKAFYLRSLPVHIVTEADLKTPVTP